MTDNTLVTEFDPTRYFPSSPDKIGDMIALARSDFEALAAKINASADSAADVRKNVKAGFIGDEGLNKTATRWYIEQADTLTRLMDENPGLSVVIIELLKNLVSDAREWSEMDIAVATTEVRQANEIDDDLVDVAEEIRSNMQKLYEMNKMFNLDLPANIPTKTRQVKGGGEATIIVTSRLNVSDRTNVGRGAKRQKFVVSFKNGDDSKWSPVDAPTPQAAVLKSGHSWRKVLDLIKSQLGDDFKWDRTFDVNNPDGTTFRFYRPDDNNDNETDQANDNEQ